MISEQLTPTQKKLRGLIQHVAMHEASIALIRSTTMCKDKQDTLVIPRINAILVAKQEIETLTKGLAMPKFYECGCCGHMHNETLPGYVDCRDDNHRFTCGQLDAQYGTEGWEQVEQPSLEGTSNHAH